MQIITVGKKTPTGNPLSHWERARVRGN